MLRRVLDHEICTQGRPSPEQRSQFGLWRSDGIRKISSNASISQKLGKVAIPLVADEAEVSEEQRKKYEKAFENALAVLETSSKACSGKQAVATLIGVCNEFEAWTR